MYPGLADHQFGKEGNVDEATHAAREQVDDRGAEIINQAKQKAEDNLRNVLRAYGVTIDQLSEGRRSQVTNALS
jgi:hypothetical protein